MSQSKDNTLSRGMLREEPVDPEDLVGAVPWQPGERTGCFRPTRSLSSLVFPVFFLSVITILSIWGLLTEGSPRELVLPLLVISLFMLSLIAWQIRRERIAGKCTRCGSCAVDGGFFTDCRSRWCNNCDLLLRPEEFETPSGEWCFVDEGKMLAEPDPVVKYLSMWMLLSMCDRVDELSFVPEEDDYHCRVRIGSEVYEMDSLAHIHRRLAGLARAIWGCDAAGDSPATGQIVVRCGSRSATVEAEFIPRPVGERVVFRFSDHQQTD